MAIDDLNAKGVMIGGKKAKFELARRRRRRRPEAGHLRRQQARRREGQRRRRPPELGHHDSGIEDLQRRRHSADLAVGHQPEVHAPGLQDAFRVVADDVQLGGTLGRYAVNTLKGKSIVTIDDRTAYGQGVAEEFAKAVKASGGKIRTPSTRPTRPPTSPPS